MAPGMLNAVLGYLNRVHGRARPGDGPDDAELLRRFAACRDEAAFAALVARHGPMVWGVCRRMLDRPQDAEDAFQAVFLVMLRKSRRLLQPDLLGPWLHAVALKTAARLRAGMARRRQRERPLVAEPVMESTPEVVWRDLRPVLDEEVGRLPARYRAAFILCCLEGLTNEAAARRLGCPKGTVLSRLSRGRELLRRRLVRRGLGLSAAALAAVLTARDCSAAVPAALTDSTLRLGLAFAVGGASASLSAPAALAKGVLKSMFLTKVKLVAAVLLTLGVLGMGAGLVAFGAGRTPQAAPIQKAPDGKPAAAEADAKPPADEDNKAAAANVPVEEQARVWHQEMDKPVSMDELDKPNLTLGEALGLFEKRYGLRFEINDAAFAEEGMAQVLGQQIASPDRWPLSRMKNVTLATALRVVLDRLPVPALAVIRRDTVEITTVHFMRAELGIPEDKPLLPLVWEEMDGVPLPRALQQLAKASGMNVVLDPRALTDDAATLKITAQFASVPVDAAVRVLANMADLQAVQVGNVFYVTTPKRAAQLLGEQKRPPNEDVLPVPQTPRQSGRAPQAGAP